MLGNTPAICRRCYIHPRIFDGYLDDWLALALKRRADAALSAEQPARTGLSAEEMAVMAFLSRRRTLEDVAEQGGTSAARVA